MTTTSSQTTSGDTESSASAGPSAQDISPIDKKMFINHLSKCQGTSNSPMKIARRGKRFFLAVKCFPYIK